MARQTKLVEDLAEKLPEQDRARFLSFLENIKETESLKDSQLVQAEKESETAKETALIQSVDAGKWYGIRNLGLTGGIAGFLFIAFQVLQKIKPPLAS